MTTKLVLRLYAYPSLPVLYRTPCKWQVVALQVMPTLKRHCNKINMILHVVSVH